MKNFPPASVEGLGTGVVLSWTWIPSGRIRRELPKNPKKQLLKREVESKHKQSALKISEQRRTAVAWPFERASLDGRRRYTKRNV